MIKATEFCEKLKAVATAYRTVYMKGVFGAPLSKALLQQKAAQYPDWYTAAKVETLEKLLKAAGGTPVFGFDCVCLLKGILWGWCGDATKPHGGAVYASGGVPDLSVEGMIGVSKDACRDFSSLQPGELLYLTGHVGVYIGDGLAVECTPAWQGGVQITGVANMGDRGSYPGRKWLGHCKLPYVEYPAAATAADSTKAEEKSTAVQLPTLHRGDKNEAVRAMQALLCLRGQSVGRCGTDGSFGGDTLSALKGLQAAKGLPVTGVCSGSDWKKLLGI